MFLRHCICIIVFSDHFCLFHHSRVIWLWSGLGLAQILQYSRLLYFFIFIVLFSDRLTKSRNQMAVKNSDGENYPKMVIIYLRW